MFHGSPDDCQLLSCIASRGCAKCTARGLPNPLGHGQTLSSCELANLAEFPLIQQNLQTLTHSVSMIHSR